MRYVFGDYSLDLTQYELRHAGRLVPVEPRVFDLLAYLVQQAGQTVPTETLLAHLYPDQFAPVERLTNAVTHARKALGETSQAPRYIQTVRHRGYRFMAPVTVAPPPALDRPCPPAAGPTAAAPPHRWGCGTSSPRGSAVPYRRACPEHRTGTGCCWSGQASGRAAPGHDPLLRSRRVDGALGTAGSRRPP